jgi:hypothetical protein
MVRRSQGIPLPEPASLTNSPPASLREAFRAGLKICERCRLDAYAPLWSTLRISSRTFSFGQQSPRRGKYPHRNGHRQRQQNDRHQQQRRESAKDPGEYDYRDQQYE